MTAIQDDKYQELLEAIQQADERLTHSKPQYIPQNSRHKANCLADMGDYFFKQTLYREALPYYAQARDILKDDATFLNQIGVCLTNLGKIARAIWVFYLMERRTNSKQDKALAFYNIAWCHQMLKQLKEAYTAIKKSLKYDSDDPDSLNMLDQLKVLTATKAFMTFKRGLFVTNPVSETESNLNSNPSLRYD